MIIITGDSWGVGEYSEDYQLSGPGFANYLALNNTVVNLCNGDSSNTQAIVELETFLYKLNPRLDLQHDTFYWIVTDPIRCVESIPCTSLKTTTTTALHDSLKQANEIAYVYGIKLKLIGGLCDLHNTDISEFINLEIAVPSWCQLLMDNYNASLYGDISRWTKIGNEIEDISEWTDIACELDNKFKSLDELKDTFFTTCGHHPDRNGHLALRDYLYPEFKNFK